MQSVRDMLAEVTGSPEFGTDLDGDMELGASGIDSGDLVRLVLLIERHTGATVSVEDVARLRTINDFETYVAATAAQAGRATPAAADLPAARPASSAAGEV